jgi:pentapeptide repeat protein
VPDTDKNGESGQTDDGSRPSRRPGPAWLPSLWLWPAIAIALTGISGALFGTMGVLLVGGEALAALVLTACILTFSHDGRLSAGLAAALVAVLAVVADLAWVPQFHHPSTRPAATPTRSESRTQPPDWQWRTVSQGMAQRADFRGADLDNANLAGLQLAHKNFDGAQADGADFRGSQLEDASLRGASLRGACLEGANLTGADLTGADFTGADVAGVTVLPKAKKAAFGWPSARATPAPACQ